jgi:hypothetical protein
MPDSHIPIRFEVQTFQNWVIRSQVNRLRHFFSNTKFYTTKELNYTQHGHKFRIPFGAICTCEHDMTVGIIYQILDIIVSVSIMASDPERTHE